MQEKHAYMIMAHHRPDLLQELLDAIDDPRNDIIIHIDKKSAMDPSIFHVNKARMYFVDRMNVNWGGYTQIECEYKLLKKAVDVGTHSYYHFLTGVNYPLWNQDYIHLFFANNYGKEFIGFHNERDYSIRLKYYIPFSEFGKVHGISGTAILYFRKLCVVLQKVLLMNRIKNNPLIIKKGCAYFSITEGLAKEIIKNEKKIEKMMKHTLCCDEVFVHTIAFNSKYREQIYNLEDEWEGSMREFAWPSNIGEERPGCNYLMRDLDYLLNSKRLFAMKFESEEGMDLIREIKEKRHMV